MKNNQKNSKSNKFKLQKQMKKFQIKRQNKFMMNLITKKNIKIIYIGIQMNHSKLKLIMRMKMKIHQINNKWRKSKKNLIMKKRMKIKKGNKLKKNKHYRKMMQCKERQWRRKLFE